MASPTQADVRFTSVTTAANPLTITTSTATPTAGQLMLLYWRSPSGATYSSGLTGWTALVSNDTSDATDDSDYIWYKTSDGTEATTVSVTFSATTKIAAVAFLISGAENAAIQAPEASTVMNFTTTANTANATTVTPTGGLKDYLFYSLLGYDGESGSPTGAPSGYVGLNSTNTGTGGAVATNCVVGESRKAATAASEDAGNWTHPAAATGGSAWTIAVHPAGAAAAVIPDVVMAPPGGVR